MKKQYEIYSRKSIFSELQQFCIMSKENDYIEVTEWHNGEGVDIDINGDIHIPLTYGYLDAIKFLVDKLNTINV